MRSTWFEEDRGPRRPQFMMRWPQTVVGVLLIANIVVFLLQNIFMNISDDAFGRYLSLDCNKILSGSFIFYLYQFLTYQFLHGNLLHILINMIVLWFFGRELESFLGSRRFLFLYLASGIMGGILFLVWSGFSGFRTQVVGASGAIYGIVVYYAMMWPRKTVNVFLFPFMIPMKVMHMAMLFVGISLFSGLFSSGDGVAHFCHLGGALFGYLFFRYEHRMRATIDQTLEWKQRREEENDMKRQAEVDRLLRKIHEDGIGSLTPSERDYLNKASRKLRKDK